MFVFVHLASLEPLAPRREQRPVPGPRAEMGDGRRRVLVGALANAGAAMNFSTIEIAVMLMGDAEGLTRSWEMAVLDSLVFAGCIIGMCAFGYLGDLYGRLRALQFTMWLSVLGIVASAGTPMDTPAEVAVVLCASRFLLGIGIGGCYPLAAALAYEADEERAELAVASANFGQPVGVLALYLVALAIYATPDLDPSFRWRSLLLFGAAPFLAALALAASLDTAKDRPRPPKDAPLARAHPSATNVCKVPHVERAAELGDLWRSDADFRRSLTGAALAWFGYNAYAYGIICYYPELTASILGRDVGAVLTSAIYAGVAQFVAAVASVLHVTRVGSRSSLAYASSGACAFCAFLTLYRFADTENSVLLLVLFILLRGAVQFPGIAVYTLPNTFAPSHVRARAHGLAAAVGKVGAIAGSASYPLILESLGLGVVFLVSAVIAGASAVAGLAVPPPPPRPAGLEGKPLLDEKGALR